jgi:hypothetical protein
MTMMMAFLGNEGTSTITAVSAVVDAFRVASAATAGIVFKSTGAEQGLRNESVIGLGNWVSPATTAAQWEIRATLDSGAVPTTGSLGVWQGLTVDRSWTIVANVDETVTSSLTFEFRKVGGTTPEFTITGTVLTAESTGIL